MRNWLQRCWNNGLESAISGLEKLYCRGEKFGIQWNYGWPAVDSEWGSPDVYDTEDEREIAFHEAVKRLQKCNLIDPRRPNKKRLVIRRVNKFEGIWSVV